MLEPRCGPWRCTLPVEVEGHAVGFRAAAVDRDDDRLELVRHAHARCLLFSASSRSVSFSARSYWPTSGCASRRADALAPAVHRGVQRPAARTRRRGRSARRGRQAAGRWAARARPSAEMVADTSMTSSSGRNGMAPLLRTLTACTSPRSLAQRGDQAHRRLRVERAAALLRALPAWCSRVGSAYRSSSVPRPPSTASAAGRRAELLAPAPRRARRSSAGSTTARMPSMATSELGSSTSSASSPRCACEQFGQPVDAVHGDAAFPGQVVEPDVVEHHAAGSTPSSAANRRWKPIATLHSPTARCPASSSARVTMPTGLVKSTIQASGLGVPAAARRRRSTTGTVRSALASPPGAGRLLADAAALERERLVADPGGLPADPQLDQHDVGAVEPRRPRSEVQVTIGPDGPCAGEHPAGERADHSSRSAAGSTSAQLVDGEHVAQPGEPVDQLRRVGRPAADNGELHCYPLTPVSVTP